MSFTDVSFELLNGFGTTLLLFVVTLIFAIPLGAIFCLLALSKVKIIKYIMRCFTWIIRGTPLMLQIIVIFYVPGLVFDVPFKSRVLAVIVALTINYGVYFSEIYRGGLLSIDRGQYEASKVLGMTRVESFFKIILPQLIKKIIPAMSNEIISLVKDTALARVIAVSEIIMVAQKIVSTHAIIWVLLYTGVFYLIFNLIVSAGLKLLEKKLSYYEG